MRPDDISFVISLCRAKAGLRVAAEKPYLIESRLSPVARREGYDSVGELLAALRTRREEPLIWAVVEAMVSAETAFFRDRAPFEAFERDIYPALARARPGQAVRAWSCACATGQEVYSLAMIVQRMKADDPSVNVALNASDLSERALERAQTGVYSQFEVQRGLPIRLLTEHFEKIDDTWRLSTDIRRMVRWRRVNMIAGVSGLGRFDVIFCRNLLTGLDEPFQKKVLEDLAEVLADDGYLVLGAKETADLAPEAYHPVLGRAGLYRRNPAHRAAA